MWKKLSKIYLQLTIDVCVKTVFEICLEKKETFKNLSIVRVQCWYIKDAVTRFRQHIFEKKIISEDI